MKMILSGALRPTGAARARILLRLKMEQNARYNRIVTASTAAETVRSGASVEDLP